MKHFRHLFAVLLLLCSTVAFAESAVIDGITYELITKGKQAKVVAGDTKYRGNIVIPESVEYNGATYNVTIIGDKAFQYCYGLTSIEIPNSVTSIGYHAFNYCPAITSIESHITAGNLFAMNSSVFSSVDKAACTLYVPIGLKQTYAKTDGWSDFLNVEEVDFTGIDEILSDDSQSICYDLNGRVVENPTKGLYIKNATKVFIK